MNPHVVRSVAVGNFATSGSHSVQADDRLQKLKALCQQAKALRDRAEHLCNQLTKHLDDSRRLLMGQDRRRLPRQHIYVSL